MTMLAKMALGIRSGNRFGELLSVGCPDDLANLCVRPMVWIREKAGVIYAVTDEQTDLYIPQCDWIEYIPQSMGPSLTDCAVCCGIPEDDCTWHGIPAAILRDATCDCCGLDIAFCVYRT